MHNTVISEQMHKMLTAHLTDIETEKEVIIRSFYTDDATAGMDIESFFREYVSAINSYLKNAKIHKDGADNCPMAIIGSTVEVRDTADMDTCSYHIVLPFARKSGDEMNQASCLSPMGRALLLKTPGSRVSIKTPAGELNYEVLGISIPGSVQSTPGPICKNAASIAF